MVKAKKKKTKTKQPRILFSQQNYLSKVKSWWWGMLCRNSRDLVEAEEIERDGKNTLKNCTKMIVVNQITTMVWPVTQKLDILECEVR